MHEAPGRNGKTQRLKARTRMKPWSINPKFMVVEATDLYFIESHNKWYPVPKHWIGTFVISISFTIKSRDLK
jgi:hypothetical protein